VNPMDGTNRRSLLGDELILGKLDVFLGVMQQETGPP